MNEKDIIREAMRKKGYTQTKLAEAAGFTRQSNVSEILRGKSLRVDNFVKLLSAMGFKVIVTDGDNDWIVGEDAPNIKPKSKKKSSKFDTDKLLKLLPDEDNLKQNKVTVKPETNKKIKLTTPANDKKERKD